MNSTAISVKNIKFKYPQAKNYAVEDISFDIKKGSYTAIVGYNGSGKSSLARIICGLENQESGSVEIAESLRIGMVFQSPKNQIVSGIVSRDTAFGPQNLKLDKSEIELRTIESLNVVQMLDRAESSTSALSLGQTQKIALSGMIALRPEILILDEALSMLDPLSRQDIHEFLRYWHKAGNTIIQITHDMEVVNEAQYVIGIEKGKKIFEGSKEDFLKVPQNLLILNGPELKKCPKSQLAQKSNKKVSLKVQNLNYSYDKNPTLQNINFSLYQGSLNAITGPSGSGKSTILEICSGLISAKNQAKEGENKEPCKILGISRPSMAQQNAAAALFETFAADDVAFGPLNKGVKGKKLKELVKKSMDLAAIPFEEFGERQTFSLSGGEQRRLSIAGILALDSDIIFFDEPTAGLDSRARYKVLTMMKELAQAGKTVLFSTHKEDEAEFADRQIKIQKGSIVEDSCPQKSDDLEEDLIELESYSSASMLKGLRSSQHFLQISTTKKSALIRRFPAWIKILLFLALFITSMCIKALPVCIAGLLISFLYAHLSGFEFKKLMITYLKILPFLLIFSLFQMIFHPPLAGEIHYTEWKWFLVTPSKIIFVIASLIRTFASISVFCGFFVSTPEYDLIDGFKGLLTPLTWIKIPVRYFILILEIIFRFIPLLIEEASSIIKTQIIRGGMGKVKGAMGKIKATMPLIIPMIIQTIKRSEALADAITMRGFN
ncbi:MAG: ATP-binding cassette domain-containing protein [Treponema sp.]|nr:ATP-binding cassette domain-containing protein [Treponema sp.]